MKNCTHPTCGDECRRVKSKYIKPRGKKLQKETRDYIKEADGFIQEGDECEMKTPVCTGMAVCIHHVRGRGKMLKIKEHWKKSCWPCNDWVEKNHDEAVQMGLKKSRLNKN